MAKHSESIDERMERKRIEFEQRKSESKKRMDEHRQSVESDKSFNDLTVTIDIDVSDALKGLKAVQREAKNTVRALREVEELSDKRIIDSLTDDEIFDILSHRGWVIDSKSLATEGRILETCVKAVKIYDNILGGI